MEHHSTRKIAASARLSLAGTLAAAALACGPMAGQQGLAVPSPDPSVAEVHLEPHDGGQQFHLGDLIRLDLVFTSRSPGYIVNTAPDTYLPPPDLVQVTPQDGTFHSHLTLYGQSQDGSFVKELGSESLRVPVLLNRSVVFQKPGHYEISITTERLRPVEAAYQAGNEPCRRCRSTNAVGIDLIARSEGEESALVRTLSNELADTQRQSTDNPTAGLGKDAEPLLKEMEVLMRTAPSDPDNQKQLQVLQGKLSSLFKDQVNRGEQRLAARIDLIQQLAYLGDEDAVRAKVRFIAAAGNSGNETDVALMRDGLPDSRNVQLQYDLLHEAWRDPENVPSFELHLALRQARELANHQPVTDMGRIWAGTPQPRDIVRAEFANDFHEIVLSLPQRSGANRTSALKLLSDQNTLLSPADAALLHPAAP